MFQPAVGGQLTVALPGETVRSTVVRVVSKHRVLIELTHQPLNPAKTHTYRVGDVVCCDRVDGELGERWEAVDERRLALPPESKPRKPAVKKARATRVRKRRLKRKAKA